MNIPCIVTDINGCNEIIIDGVNGMIIPKKNVEALYNAMLFVYNNPDSIRQLALNCRALIASRYAQNDVWRKTLERYQLLLNR